MAVTFNPGVLAANYLMPENYTTGTEMLNCMYSDPSYRMVGKYMPRKQREASRENQHWEVFYYAIQSPFTSITSRMRSI
jgi:hypothetical protein